MQKRVSQGKNESIKTYSLDLSTELVKLATKIPAGRYPVRNVIHRGSE